MEEPAAAAPAADAATDAAGAAAAGLSATIQEERQPNAHVQMMVTIPPEACEDLYAKEIEWWRKKTDVPGFRKTGKKGKQVGARLQRTVHHCAVTPAIDGSSAACQQRWRAIQQLQQTHDAAHGCCRAICSVSANSASAHHRLPHSQVTVRLRSHPNQKQRQWLGSGSFYT